MEWRPGQRATDQRLIKMQELRASAWLPSSYDVASCMKRQPRRGRGVIAGKELRSSHARGSKHCKRGSHATRKTGSRRLWGMAQGCSFSYPITCSLRWESNKPTRSYLSDPGLAQGSPYLGMRSGAAGTRCRALRRHRSAAAMVCFTRGLRPHRRCNTGI